MPKIKVPNDILESSLEKIEDVEEQQEYVVHLLVVADHFGLVEEMEKMLNDMHAQGYEYEDTIVYGPSVVAVIFRKMVD